MFDLDTCVAFITNKASKMMADAFNERLMLHGITRVQWIALYYLGKYEGINQKELAEKMNIKSSTVARLLDRMEKDGLVKRQENPEDRRVTKIRLTEKGKELREKFLPEGEKMSEIFSRGLTDEELEVFTRVLKKMVDNIS
ncbi:MarR family transcriptional regulator [Biomaibacter acetigenes]|uniref:MarR family transcriptional regulator n=1 Tax=Biomaibacter acetigenes TaxID=2316383 RepID=A0A3G2R7N7_9FIRM|nr:MarR family transcriptional regulator [Biomaibacter acetigenes]AYO31098.1 MarR family transcriptional regulator [Biomaibacter acetigenes]